jgi:hypothetical protein
MLAAMAAKINLADPSFEPTDEQLMELSRQAFAGIAAKKKRIDLASQAKIAELQKSGLAELKKRLGRTKA